MIDRLILAYFKLMLCVGLTYSLSSCSKERANQANQDASLSVSVTGLEDYVMDETPIALQEKNDPSKHKSNGVFNSMPFNAEETLTNAGKEREVQFFNDFDVDFEIAKMHPASEVAEQTHANDNALRLSKTRSLVARQPLGTAVRYRLLIYRQNETVPIVNVEARGANFPPVAIASGFNYRWIAVSTNETTSSPTVSNNMVSASQIANKDFLYASGTIFTQYGQNYLNIVFKRYTSQIQLTVDSRGMFGDIAANSNMSFVINGAGTLSETADFNVRDSSFSNFQPVSLSSNTMTNTDPALRVGTIYTVRPRAVEAGSLQLRMNPLHLTLDDGSTRTFTDNTLTFGSAFLPMRGSSYAISARLIESGIRIGTSPVRWARSNLTYRASAPEGFRYRFRPHAINYTFDPNVDSWNFGTSVPTNRFEGVETCRRVYPAGTWKYPENTDLAQLGNPNSIESYTLPGTGGTGLVANWDRSSNQPANNAYPGMDHLRLPFHGYRTAANAMVQQPVLNGTQLSGQGNYFARNYNIIQVDPTTLAPTRVRPHYLRMVYSGQNVTGATSNLNGYTQSMVTNDINSEHQGRSIRCVRVVNPS